MRIYQLMAMGSRAPVELAWSCPKASSATTLSMPPVHGF